MNKEDLKLGNMLHFHGTPCRVEELRRGDMELGYFVDSIGFSRPYDDEGFSPILLDEGWMINMGFEKVNDRWVKGKFSGHLMGDLFFYCDGVIRYVHQLQNLYYDITGKKLY